MPWSSQAFGVQSWAVGKQEFNCTPTSLRNADPISGVRTGVLAMGEEYPEEDAGDARRADVKNGSISGATRGVGARSIGELNSGCRIKGTAIMGEDVITRGKHLGKSNGLTGIHRKCE
jgi:hypothetical protein